MTVLFARCQSELIPILTSGNKKGVFVPCKITMDRLSSILPKVHPLRDGEIPMRRAPILPSDRSMKIRDRPHSLPLVLPRMEVTVSNGRNGGILDGGRTTLLECYSEAHQIDDLRLCDLILVALL